MIQELKKAYEKVGLKINTFKPSIMTNLVMIAHIMIDILQISVTKKTLGTDNQTLEIARRISLR